MGKPSLCYSVFLALSLFMVSANLNNNTANLSSLWINNRPTNTYPFPTNTYPLYLNSSDFSGTTLTLIFDGSYSSQLVSGFYCPYNETACFFGVVIFAKSDWASDTYYLINSPELVWSANRNRPVKVNATLQLKENGDLVLADADGTLVWSTNTSGKSVVGLRFTDWGNLVLFDRNNATVWQSFDYPTDCLLLGQELVLGQKLIARSSASNWSQGLFSFALQYNSFLAYVESTPTLVYSESFLDSINTSFKFDNGSFGRFHIPRASTAQFMRLEPDGHLKVYESKGNSPYWNVVDDLLTSDVGDCGYPTVCGNYGVCSKGQCSCLEEANNGTSSFRTINYRQPNLGCSLVTPISCDHSQYHSLLELKNTSYFNLNLNSYSSYYLHLDENTNVEDCKTTCLRNCSCKAALFAYQVGSYSKGCLLLFDVYSLMNVEGSNDNVSIFLKVQKSPNELLYPLPIGSPQKKSRNFTIILGSSLGSFFGILFMVASCIFLLRKRSEFEEFDEFPVDQVKGMPTRFSYEELKSITNNFDKKLGEGGFGSVFQGTLSNGTQVAVKRLDGLGQIKKSFFVEVETIGSIHHVNLVRLIGFCAEKSYRLLVYEYMSNGSLDKWIFQRHQEITLGWQSRRKIIVDVAKGLAYLHEECTQKIYHLDIKPQNILLDEHFNAKISDFGLSKLIDKDKSKVVTNLRGTPGYLAPEWLSSIITEKVDVYSFGVVVLEILCGRKNVDRSQPEEDMHLLTIFKRKAEEDRLLDIVDKHNMEIQLHGEEVVEMMRVAMWCLQGDFSKRPSMSVVVKVLQGYVDVEQNLNYNFTNHVVPRTSPQEDAIGTATPQIPSVLSGPR